MADVYRTKAALPVARIPISAVLVVLSSLVSLHGSGTVAIIAICALFCLEGFFLATFTRIIFHDRSLLRAASVMSLISIATYTFLFPYINALELWVDEIQVIRFGQLPLSDIAKTVMREHVAVPPLDYWNMWFWNHLAQRAPVSIMEFVYRIPYMIMHTLSAILIAFSFRNIFPKALLFTDRLLIYLAFCLYFYNPWLLTYSYEVRFYGPMLLGGAVVLYLYYHDKLFEPEYAAIPLLFALNSVYQFIILSPFLLLSLILPTVRKRSITLRIGFLCMALLILPFLFIPASPHGLPATYRIRESLLYLYYFYFDTPWKQIIAAELVVVAIFFRRRSAYLIGVSALMASAVALLNARMNYMFFGAKHFLFTLPFLSMAILELYLIHRSTIFRWIVTSTLLAMFILPFFTHLEQTLKNETMAAKSPMGLKVLFQKSLLDKTDIMVEYGDASEEDISYVKKAISLYSSTYRQIRVREYRFGDGCDAQRKAQRSILYIIPQTSMCADIWNSSVHIFGARVLFPLR